MVIGMDSDLLYPLHEQEEVCMFVCVCVKLTLTNSVKRLLDVPSLVLTVSARAMSEALTNIHPIPFHSTLPFFSQLHNGIPGSVFHVLKTEDGHDGFLLEQDLVGQHISEFLKDGSQ